MTASIKLQTLANTPPAGSNAADLGNTGISLLHGGFYPAAEAYLTRALELAPEINSIYAPLAMAYCFNNKPFHAVVIGFEAVKRDHAESQNFGVILKNVPVNTFNPLYRQIMEYMLANNLYQDNFINVFCDTIRLDPRYAPLWQKNDMAAALACVDDVLRHFLARYIVAERRLEHALTRLRAHLATLPETAHADTRAAFIAQGLLNEYVWSMPDTLPQSPASRFMFENLTITDIEAAKQVLAALPPTPANDIIADHIEFRTRLPDLAAQSPAFGAIADETSLKVQQQYEENPYPQWRNARTARAQEFMHVLPEIRPLQKQKTGLLIAGCGTGQQIVFARDTFPRADITAIDLSRASLAYARYRLEKMGIHNPDLRQGDILDTAALGKTFGIIECMGVLHHMQEPEKGLAALTSVLQTGGHMRLGLYSRAARQHIYNARDLVAHNTYPATPDGIRACRTDIMQGNTGQYQNVLALQDFYTMSACRDLIFHVQEHGYTIPGLADMLDRHGLEFISFELPGSLYENAFRATYGPDTPLSDLPKWQAIEEAFPAMFLGMYNFWVRKK